MGDAVIVSACRTAIGTARKGWLTRKDVVNCLPLGKIEAVLAAKRTRKK